MVGEVVDRGLKMQAAGRVPRSCGPERTKESAGTPRRPVLLRAACQPRSRTRRILASSERAASPGLGVGHSSEESQTHAEMSCSRA